MGYASRNNPLTKEKLISVSTYKKQEVIRNNPTRAYYQGLISWDQLQFIKSNPSKIEQIIHEMLEGRHNDK